MGNGRPAEGFAKVSLQACRQGNQPLFVLRCAEDLPKYDIPELKQLAWEKILKELDSCDLVEEIFSDFTFL